MITKSLETIAACNILWSLLLVLFFQFQLKSALLSGIRLKDVFCDRIGGTQCDSDATCVYNAINDYSFCECNEGFIGDGFECERFDFEINKSECSRHSMCQNGESCVIATKNGRFATNCVKKDVLQISKGLINNPQPTTTTTRPKDRCNSDKMCHTNASCVFDTKELLHTCKCHQYFVGDGFSLCVPGPGEHSYISIICP